MKVYLSVSDNASGIFRYCAINVLDTMMEKVLSPLDKEETEMQISP